MKSPAHPIEKGLLPPQRIRRASIILILGMTLACGSIPSGLETSVTPLPASEIAGTQEAPLVQIGHFDSLYLRYDPEVWEAFHEYQDPG